MCLSVLPYNKQWHDVHSQSGISLNNSTNCQFVNSLCLHLSCLPIATFSSSSVQHTAVGWQLVGYSSLVLLYQFLLTPEIKTFSLLLYGLKSWWIKEIHPHISANFPVISFCVCHFSFILGHSCLPYFFQKIYTPGMRHIKCMHKYTLCITIWHIILSWCNLEESNTAFVHFSLKTTLKSTFTD